MKKIFKLLTLPLLTFLVISCKKDTTSDKSTITESKNKGTIIEKWLDVLTSNIQIDGSLKQTITTTLALAPEDGKTTKKVESKIKEKISDDKFYQDVDGIKHFYEKSKKDDENKGKTIEKQLSTNNTLKEDVIVRHDDEDDEDYTMDFDAYFTNPFKEYTLDDFYLVSDNSFELENDRYIEDVIYQLFDTDLTASELLFVQQDDKLFIKAKGEVERYSWGWSIEDIDFEYNCQISKLEEDPFEDIKVKESTIDSQHLNEALEEMSNIKSYTLVDTHSYINELKKQQTDIEKMLISENAIIDENEKKGYAKFDNNKQYSFTYKENNLDASKNDITRVERIEDLNTNEYYKPYYNEIKGEVFTKVSENTFTLENEVDRISMFNKLLKNESEKQSAEFGISVGGEYDLEDFKLTIEEKNNKYHLKQIDYIIHGEKHSYSYDFNSVNLDSFNGFKTEYTIPEIDKGEWVLDDYELTFLDNNCDFKDGLTLNISVDKSNNGIILMNNKKATDVDVIKDSIYFTIDNKEYDFSYIDSKPYDGAPDQGFLTYDDSTLGRMSITLTRSSDI